jgi:hypothetical protein
MRWWPEKYDAHPGLRRYHPTLRRFCRPRGAIFAADAECHISMSTKLLTEPASPELGDKGHGTRSVRKITILRRREVACPQDLDRERRKVYTSFRYPGPVFAV